MKNIRQVQVFLAEDNMADVWLVEEALRRQSLDYHLEHYLTAEDAIVAVKASGSADSQIPDLMLVDFNLPRGDGRDVLAAAASNPKLAAVPKVVMSSFLRPEEMEQATHLGALCFIPKPTGLDAFLTTVGAKVMELLGRDKEEPARPTGPGG
jgi:chemotaxis family two-component system response regulator Rcp1